MKPRNKVREHTLWIAVLFVFAGLAISCFIPYRIGFGPDYSQSILLDDNDWSQLWRGAEVGDRHKLLKGLLGKEFQIDFEGRVRRLEKSRLFGRGNAEAIALLGAPELYFDGHISYISYDIGWRESPSLFAVIAGKAIGLSPIPYDDLRVVFDANSGLVCDVFILR